MQIQIQSFLESMNHSFSLNMETSVKTCEWQIQCFKIVGKAGYFSKESKLKEIKCLKAKVC